jgi:hypothetical protein
MVEGYHIVGPAPSVGGAQTELRERANSSRQAF